MHDLTRGSIAGHIVHLSLPIGIGMLFQTLYHLIDLYFVGQLGDAAIAGVSAAGNVQLIVIAFTQILGVGAMALIGNAVGRKDMDDLRLIFNQSLSLAAVCAALVLGLGYILAPLYMDFTAADAATRAAGKAYLFTFLPGLALQFALVVLGSALRGTGVARPVMLIQLVSVLTNALLAPVLIAGWGTGVAFGVTGAGLATTIAVGVGVLFTVWYVRRHSALEFRRENMLPRWREWRRIFAIGLPPGGEVLMMFVYMVVIFWVLAGVGAHAQAGFGIGQRVMQAVFLPAMALAFGAAPVAAQNVGAGHLDRVWQTFRDACLMTSALMVVLTALCLWQPEILVASFSDDPAVIDVATGFLSTICWNFLPTGIMLTCSGLFQALGHTLPALLASATRVFTFMLPTLWLAQRASFELQTLWWLSVTAVAIQAVICLALLLREFRRRGIGRDTTAVSQQTA